MGRSRAKKVIAAGAFAHPWATVQGLVNAPRRRAFFAAAEYQKKPNVLSATKGKLPEEAC